MASVFEMFPFLYLKSFSLKKQNLSTGEHARNENAFERFRGSFFNIFIVLFSHLLWWEAAWEGRGQFRRLALSSVQSVEMAPYLLQNSFSLKMPLPKRLFSIKKTPTNRKIKRHETYKNRLLKFFQNILGLGQKKRLW